MKLTEMVNAARYWLIGGAVVIGFLLATAQVEARVVAGKVFCDAWDSECFWSLDAGTNEFGSDGPAGGASSGAPGTDAGGDPDAGPDPDPDSDPEGESEGKPGHGFGDKNHGHTGPPGRAGKTKGGKGGGAGNSGGSSGESSK